jgi:hypothetical protein
MDHPQTPRILAPHLNNFQHRIVRMLGKVVQLRGDTAVIDAGGNVDVILNRVSSITNPHPLLAMPTQARTTYANERERIAEDGKREDMS